MREFRVCTGGEGGVLAVLVMPLGSVSSWGHSHVLGEGQQLRLADEENVVHNAG